MGFSYVHPELGSGPIFCLSSYFATGFEDITEKKREEGRKRKERKKEGKGRRKTGKGRDGWDTSKLKFGEQLTPLRVELHHGFCQSYLIEYMYVNETGIA